MAIVAAVIIIAIMAIETFMTIIRLLFMFLELNQVLNIRNSFQGRFFNLSH